MSCVLCISNSHVCFELNKARPSEPVYSTVYPRIQYSSYIRNGFPVGMSALSVHFEWLIVMPSKQDPLHPSIQIPNATGTDATHVLFFLTCRICPSRKQAEMWTRLSTEHISIVFQFSSGPENSLALLLKIDAWITQCTMQFLGSFLDATEDNVQQQWFPRVLPSPCGYVRHSSITVPNAVAPKGSKVTLIRFLP